MSYQKEIVAATFWRSLQRVITYNFTNSYPFN